MEDHELSKFRYLKILDVPGRDYQIVIFRASGGAISYAKRWWNTNTGAYGELGPACGLYDSPETAEREAKIRNEI